MYVVIYLISIKFVDVVFWLLVRMLYYGATENSWEPDSSELPLSLTENELFSEIRVKKHLSLSLTRLKIHRHISNKDFVIHTYGS